MILYADPARILRGRSNFPSAPPVLHIPTRPSSSEMSRFVVLDGASLHCIALAIGRDICHRRVVGGGCDLWTQRTGTSSGPLLALILDDQIFTLCRQHSHCPEYPTAWQHGDLPTVVQRTDLSRLCNFPYTSRVTLGTPSLSSPSTTTVSQSQPNGPSPDWSIFEAYNLVLPDVGYLLASGVLLVRFGGGLEEHPNPESGDIR